MRDSSWPLLGIPLVETVVDPAAIVVAVGFDHEAISLPVAYRITKVARNRRIGRQLAPICPDRSPHVAHFKKLQSSARQLDKFDPVVVGIAPRKTIGVADILRIF